MCVNKMYGYYVFVGVVVVEERSVFMAGVAMLAWGWWFPRGVAVGVGHSLG